MTTKEPDIWLQEYEDEGIADCGCRLDSTGPDGMPGAALYYCPMHDAAPETAAERDRLRAINETLVGALEAILRECETGTVALRSIGVCGLRARAALAAAREEVQG